MYTGVETLVEELEHDYSKKKLNEIYNRDPEKDDNTVNFLQSAGTLHKFVFDFSVLNDTQIFRIFWSNALSLALECKPDLNVDDVYNNVWQPCFSDCQKFLRSLSSLTIALADVDRYLKPYKRALDTELSGLFQCWTKCNTKEQFEQENIAQAIKKVKQYWSFCGYREGAIVLLKICDSLELKRADFINVENISKEVSMKYPINQCSNEMKL